MNSIIHRRACALAGLILALPVLSAAASQPYGFMPYSDALLHQWQTDRAAMPVYRAPGGSGSVMTRLSQILRKSRTLDTLAQPGSIAYQVR